MPALFKRCSWVAGLLQGKAFVQMVQDFVQTGFHTDIELIDFQPAQFF
jgi:hypothetical protein